MQDRVEAFLHYLSAERGSSKNTIDAYRNDLGGFRRFIEANDFDAPEIAKSITRNSITAYIGDLNERRYAKATVARKVAAVKSFCTFLLDHGDLISNPATQVDSPRAPKPVPKPMTTAEVDLLLHEPRKYDSPEAARDAAMLELMYATGMRVTELVSLNLDSVHL
ncbi:MAG: site-specific integrase, partial [Dehalococcoidia bacterium]